MTLTEILTDSSGLFYNEYPPATSCLRSMTFGRIAGVQIAQELGQQVVPVR